jgi:surface protein
MEGSTPRRVNAVIIEWRARLPEDLWLPILSHLDVKTLIEKKQVCRTWRHTCTEAIDAKRTPTTRKVFTTNKELCDAVKKYCGYNSQCDPHDAEEIAHTYGYPINKWDVSSLQDFDSIFYAANTFNEDISSWNVSNATTMSEMFYSAYAFNQDLSSWNMSNVTDMEGMFHTASSFNQNLSLWNVSNVQNMSDMFLDAASFNWDIDSWELWDSSKL